MQRGKKNHSLGPCHKKTIPIRALVHGSYVVTVHVRKAVKIISSLLPTPVCEGDTIEFSKTGNTACCVTGGHYSMCTCPFKKCQCIYTQCSKSCIETARACRYLVIFVVDDVASMSCFAHVCAESYLRNKRPMSMHLQDLSHVNLL
jgi:hypothetical protein